MLRSVNTVQFFFFFFTAMLSRQVGVIEVAVLEARVPLKNTTAVLVYSSVHG